VSRGNCTKLNPINNVLFPIGNRWTYDLELVVSLSALGVLLESQIVNESNAKLLTLHSTTTILYFSYLLLCGSLLSLAKLKLKYFIFKSIVAIITVLKSIYNYICTVIFLQSSRIKCLRIVRSRILYKVLKEINQKWHMKDSLNGMGINKNYFI
jgi:hypothetical protein